MAYILRRKEQGQKQTMELEPRRILHTTAAVLSAALLFLSFMNVGALSQSASTIKLIVPFPPGGGADILGRLVSQEISDVHGATFLVENRPGAGTMIATEAAARAAPDGHLLLVVANSFLINAHLKKLAYDPLTSFDPICLLTRSPNVIAVNSASPWRSLGELLADAKANPGKLTMAFQGPATGQHIATEKLKRAADVDVIDVPFLGGAPAVNALLGNHVSALFVNYPSVAEQAKAGRVRILASASRTRPGTLRDIPTVSETLHKDFEEDVWFGLVVPAGTPEKAVTKLTEWFRQADLDPQVARKLSVQGFEAAPLCGADFAAYLRQQSDEYGRVIRDAKISPE